MNFLYSFFRNWGVLKILSSFPVLLKQEYATEESQSCCGVLGEFQFPKGVARFLRYDRESETAVSEVISALITLQTLRKGGERGVESAGQWVAECGSASVGNKDQNKQWKLIHKMIHAIRTYQDDEVCEACVVCCN